MNREAFDSKHICNKYHWAGAEAASVFLVSMFSAQGKTENRNFLIQQIETRLKNTELLV